MKLLYFTNSYPYGIGEQWKANELMELVHHFESVTVIPFCYDNNFNNPKQVPEGVKVLKPLFDQASVRLKKSDLFSILFHVYAAAFLREFFERKVYRNRRRLESWMVGSVNAIRLLRHPVVRKIVQEADRDTVLYFYWGKGSCEFLPFVDTSRFRKIFVRMHRFDLFEYENRNYIPYRKALLNSITIAAPSSLAGKRHLEELYPNAKAKIDVVRCGTKGNGNVTTPSTDQVLRIASCSFLSKVKRVHLMIGSLKHVDFPILWRHVGDGVLREELEALVKECGVEDKFIFEGSMDSRAILDFYTNNTFDVFVNTSSSEGVPFSIMEAFSVRMPVIATDAGGTGEIVDDQTGMILPVNLNASDLAAALSAFYNKTQQEKIALGKEAFHRYRQYWDAEKLAIELAALLKR